MCQPHLCDRWRHSRPDRALSRGRGRPAVNAFGADSNPGVHASVVPRDAGHRCCGCQERVHDVPVVPPGPRWSCGSRPCYGGQLRRDLCIRGAGASSSMMPSSQLLVGPLASRGPVRMPAQHRRRRARPRRESRRPSLPVRRVVPRPGRYGTYCSGPTPDGLGEYLQFSAAWPPGPGTVQRTTLTGRVARCTPWRPEQEGGWVKGAGHMAVNRSSWRRRP